MIPPAFLTLPAVGERQIPPIRRKVLLAAIRGLLTLPPSAIPSGRAGLVALQRALTDALRDRRVPTEVFGAPDVLPGLLCLLSGAIPAADALDAAVPSLLAAIGPRLPVPVVWDRPIRRIVQGDRAWDLDPPAGALLAGLPRIEVDRGGSRVALDSLPATSPFHPLAGGPVLSLTDGNPLAHNEEHPEKSGNTLSLGGRDPGQWVAALDGALGLIRLALPAWADEIPDVLHRVVPVGYEPERHLSASYREAPGLAYLTLHPDPVTMAEAIVHEVQHGKLNLLSWLDPVLKNGRTFWTASPVRPDLRPLMGVLLAVHAFVPVAALHRGLIAADHPLSRTARFDERRRQVLAGNARGLALVREHGDATEIGRRIVDDLSRLHAATAEGERVEGNLERLG